MIFTIVAENNLVIVDGIGYKDLSFEIDNNIHAVQWYGTFGEIEYKNIIENGVITKPLNVLITEYSQFQTALDAWEIANIPPEPPEETSI